MPRLALRKYRGGKVLCRFVQFRGWVPIDIQTATANAVAKIIWRIIDAPPTASQTYTGVGRYTVSP